MQTCSTNSEWQWLYKHDFENIKLFYLKILLYPLVHIRTEGNLLSYKLKFNNQRIIWYNYYLNGLFTKIAKKIFSYLILSWRLSNSRKIYGNDRKNNTYIDPYTVNINHRCLRSLNMMNAQRWYYCTFRFE